MARRRGNNEGSIYQVGDHWEASVTMRRGVRRRLRRATYAEAVKARNQLLAERDRLFDLDRRLTVGQLLDEWLDDLKVRVRRPRTWQTYEKNVRLYIKPALGHLRAALLTPTEYRRFQSGLLGADRARTRPALAPSTVALIRTVLNSAYRWALAEDRLPRNPIAAIAPPEREPYQASPLTLPQAVAVLTAIREHPLGPFWTFLLATGCRFGEAAGLRWTDLDLDTATVWLGDAKAPVPKAFREPGDPTWEIGPMKTRTSQRPVPLTRFAVAALERQVEIVAALKRTPYRGRWQEHGLVFPTSAGTPLRDDHVGEQWHAMLAAIGLEQAGEPRYRLHDLRHTLGTLQRKSGTDLEVIREWLGHTDVRMTRLYAGAAVPEALRAAVERFEREIEAAAGLAERVDAGVPEGAEAAPLLPELPGYPGAGGADQEADTA